VLARNQKGKTGGRKIREFMSSDLSKTEIMGRGGGEKEEVTLLPIISLILKLSVL
jgi:hypothetical protein